MKFLDKIKTTTKVLTDKAKIHSPELLVGFGIICFGVTVYESCKATIKVKDIITEKKELLHKADIAINADAVHEDGSLYSTEDYESDKKNITVQQNVKIVKAVIKPVGGFVLASASVLCGLHILKSRYLKLAVAYNGLKKSYDILYSNVEKKYGKDEAYALANNMTKIGETEEGDPIYKKDDITEDEPNPYVVYVTPQTCRQWDHNLWEIENTLRVMEHQCNEWGPAKGYILWHDVLRDLMIRKIKPISVRVGWVFDGERVAKAEADGLSPDRKVDFRIEKLYYNVQVQEADSLPEPERKAAFDKIDELFFNPGTGKYVDCIYRLNPNLDGEIYKYI